MCRSASLKTSKLKSIRINLGGFRKHSVWTKENGSSTPSFVVIFTKTSMGYVQAQTGVSLSFILHDAGSFTVHSDITVAFYNPCQRFTS